MRIKKSILPSLTLCMFLVCLVGSLASVYGQSIGYFDEQPIVGCYTKEVWDSREIHYYAIKDRVILSGEVGDKFFVIQQKDQSVAGALTPLFIEDSRTTYRIKKYFGNFLSQKKSSAGESGECPVNITPSPSTCEQSSNIRRHSPPYSLCTLLKEVREWKEQRSSVVHLPGHELATLVTYDIIQDLPIFEGDIDITDLLQQEEPQQPARVEIFDDDVPSIHPVKPNRQPLAIDKKLKKLWPGGVIPYQNHSSITQSLQRNIQDAITHYQTFTNIRFVPYDEEIHDAYIQFRKVEEELGCQSGLGRPSKGRRKVFIGDLSSLGAEENDLTKFCLIHEIGHALGLNHEATRMDRDDFININWDQIKRGRKDQFKQRVTKQIDFGPYDCQSIMHYTA